MSGRSRLPDAIRETSADVIGNLDQLLRLTSDDWSGDETSTNNGLVTVLQISQAVRGNWILGVHCRRARCVSTLEDRTPAVYLLVDRTGPAIERWSEMSCVTGLRCSWPIIVVSYTAFARRLPAIRWAQTGVGIYWSRGPQGIGPEVDHNPHLPYRLCASVQCFEPAQNHFSFGIVDTPRFG
jgi:hypothetical protein